MALVTIVSPVPSPHIFLVMCEGEEMYALALDDLTKKIRDLHCLVTLE